MSWLTEIREKYGISQSLLAAYLSTSQSLIAMAENNVRELSGKAMILLSPFIIDCEYDPQTLHPPINARLQSFLDDEAQKAAKEAARRLRDVELKLERSRRKLASMQKKEQQALEAIALADRISFADIDQWIDVEGKNLIIQLLLANAFASLRDNGLVAQASVKETILQLEAVTKL